MTRKGPAVGIAVGASALATVLLIFGLHHWKPRWSTIQGAVIRSNSDVRKQQPIAGVEITARYRKSSQRTRSAPSGYFRIVIPRTVLPGQTVMLSFEHPGYKDLELPVVIRFRSSLQQLIVAPMQPLAVETAKTAASPSIAPTLVSNVRVRFTVNAENRMDVGSVAKTFVVENIGNRPCPHRGPCSPDGYWKASTGSIRLDAGPGNEFRDARASCIAGPCPFTKINSRDFAHGGRIITASALAWSAPAMFLVQAEVFHTTVSSEVRESYPVIFGREMNFTVPPRAEGTSLVADLGGVEIVFPLGPDLNLSWTTCSVRETNHTPNSVYQCELKPGYRF
jgi:hypothetical protein